MSPENLKLFSALDNLEIVIKPYCLHPSIHCREAAGVIIDAINEARFILIHGPNKRRKGDCHALPD